MIKLLLSAAVTCLAFATLDAFADNGPVLSGSSSSEYARLLKASMFIESYKETASVSARVFAARAQGSDKEYARFMKVVSTADLSDVGGCFINLYPNQGLTVAEAAELSSFFESPIGTKLLKSSQQMMIGDLERGYHLPLPADTFTDEERQQVKNAYQNAAFSKYSRVVAGREFASGIMRCLAASKDVQRSGIKF